jgi:hypothetical protein
MIEHKLHWQLPLPEVFYDRAMKIAKQIERDMYIDFQSNDKATRPHRVDELEGTK